MPVKLQLRIADQTLSAYTTRNAPGSAVVMTDFRATVGHVNKFALARETSAGTDDEVEQKRTPRLPASDLCPRNTKKRTDFWFKMDVCQV